MTEISTDIREWGNAFEPKWDDKGLVTAVVQDHGTKQVLMVAHMDAAAFQATLQSGFAHFYSRSRGKLWKKGETSGETQKIVAIHVDCDQDAILLEVEPQGHGSACHNGFRSCFYRKAVGSGPIHLERTDEPVVSADKLYKR